MPSFVCFVVSVFLGCAGPPKHPTWKNATGAEAHERLMWQAIRDRDWSNFERHLAPAFVGIEESGKAVNRSEWVQYWKSATVGDYSIGEVVVQPEGPDLVVTYVISFADPNPGSSQKVRILSVWQQVKSRLVLTASSITPVGNSPR
ncbi:MAG TPA: nuclear transport factor 2 family protein [Candidatus Angelobacter sp.]|nr:nuclear transport factor 2 family protein [Candidatus Angelobacter sp.]